jgi:hypothetical protein
MTGTIGRSGGKRTLGYDSTPQDTGPEKPDLPMAVTEKWDQLIEQLPKKSLRKIDCHELKLLSELLVMADNLSAAMLTDPADHKTGRLFLNTTDRIHRLSGSFGLNPGDRKRLDFPPDHEKEPGGMEILLARMTGNQGQPSEPPATYAAE